MKTLLELLPITIGVALVGAVTWFLLDRDIGFGKWLLAGLLLAHGGVHLMFVFPVPEATPATANGLAYPFQMGRSWLIRNAGMDAGAVRTVGVVVMIITSAASLLAAPATVGWLVPSEWWSGLVLAASGSSAVLLAIFFSPALTLGFAIDAALWILVIASIWSPMLSKAAGGGAA
jgi:hypothetical protein